MPLITTNNLDSVQVVSAQDNQFQTFNDKVGELDSFLTEALGVSVSAGNATVSAADYRRYRKIRITGNTTAGRSVTLQAIKREILIDNSAAANTQSIAIVLGSATLNLAVGKKAFVETDGTTNGLELVISNDAAAGGGLIPQNSQSANYTTVLADGGKHLLHPSADTTARTFTIASNASVPAPIGTAITFVNQNAAGVLTIAATDTMRLAGAGTTGSRTLAANGIATALKIGSTEWIINGTDGAYVAKSGDTMTGALAISDTTASTSPTTGALKVAGGLGVGGNVYAGGNVVGLGLAIDTTGNPQVSFYKSTVLQSFINDNGGSINVYSNAAGTAGMFIAHGASAWSAISDARLPHKKTARPLRAIDKLKHVQLYENEVDGRLELFGKAQELFLAFPHVVANGDDDPERIGQAWGVAYDRLGLVALQAVKELLARVQELEAQIKALKPE